MSTPQLKPFLSNQIFLNMLDSHFLSFLGRMCTIFILMLVSSCSSVDSDSDIDRSFLTDEPCPAPCWYHLELGKSTREDVLQSLKTLPFINPQSIKESGATWMDDSSAKSIYFGCIHPKTKDCGEITISDDRMKSIWFSVNYPLTTKMVVDKLGTPDYLDYGGYHPEVGGCVVLFYWVERGVSISIINTRNDTPCQEIREQGSIPTETQVTVISYFDNKILSSEPPAGLKRIQWPGFSQ